MIDDHVHPFPLAFEPLELAGITLDVAQDEAAADRRRSLGPGRLFQHLLEVKLAALLGVEPQDAVAARDERARADWLAWLRFLFDDAGISEMVLDEAAPPGEPARTGEYAAAAGRPMWQLARIDLLVDQLIGAGASAREVVEGVEAAMASAAAQGCVAYKTILAYRTGLAVDPTVDVATAQRELDAEPAGPVRRRGKALRDLVMRHVLARAADLGKPVQFHTGFGDSELRLAESDPLLLEDLLRTPEGQAGKVVLIHGSFPWHEQSAHLAATKANVWLELSLSNLFAPMGTAGRLLSMLDVAPTGRLLLGSDGHGAPETHWFGCTVLNDAWRQVAQDLTDAGARRDWINDAHEALFEGNAQAVYALG
jgi:uncharacterized protein